MFTPEQRDQARRRLLEMAREDPRVVAGAVVGAEAAGRVDRWSDLDLTFGVSGQATVDEVLAGWTGAVSDELEGIFLGLSGDQLRLAAEHPGEVFVTVPGGFQLPALEPGEEIELDVSVDATTGAFTLVSIRTDDENDGEHGRVEARGTITHLTDTSITVSGGREEDGDDGDGSGTPVTCAVADKSLLSGFQINDKVEMRCAEVNGTLTLVRLKKEDDDGDDD